MNKHVFSWMLAGLLALGWSSSAFAFANSDIFDSILSAHQDESRPKGMPYIDKVEQVPGTYNAWTMLFRAEVEDIETGKDKVVAMPVTLKYKGNALYIKIKLADVDRRVVDVVFKELKSEINDLKDYDSGELKGFRSNIGHNTKAVLLEGSVNISGKTLEELRELIVELREEMADFYEELYEANIDAKEDYFEDVLDEKYPSINDAQTFLEIMGNDFTLKNQVKQRASQQGHWAWKVEGNDVETINFGDYMQEVLLLKTGSGISEYKTEKMYDELAKRVKSRLPKGAKEVKVEPHYRKSGITTVAFIYPYSKRIDGEDIQDYHNKFTRYVQSVSNDLHGIIAPYVQAPAAKKVYSLDVHDFMAVVDDGLESLPIHDAPLANGQWKFKYKGVAYIITNYKSHMSLAFIYTLPRGMKLDKPSDFLEDAIEAKYATFADKYGIGGYKNSKRTLMVNMQINYGIKGSKNTTGEKIKAKYDAFTRRIAPDLQQQLKVFIGL